MRGQYVLLAVVFLLWTWVLLCLVQKCLELWYPFGGFFSSMSMEFPPPSPQIRFCLSYIKMATLACFSDLSGTFTPIFFYLDLCLSLMLRCCFYLQQKDASCFHIQSVSLCFFIRELRPMILRDIKEQHLLILVIIIVVVPSSSWCNDLGLFILCIFLFAPYFFHFLRLTFFSAFHGAEFVDRFWLNLVLSWYVFFLHLLWFKILLGRVVWASVSSNFEPFWLWEFLLISLVLF